jgi:uncharacterized protein (DUF2062 family)
MREFLRRRIVQPIIELLKQGITPEKIALSLAFGICLGVFPVLGSTTILCLAVAFLFRLNIPAIQLVNYLIYPVQIALIMPFIRLGEKIVGARPIPFSLSQMVGMLRADMWGTTVALWHTTVHAMIGWAVFGPVAIWLLYEVLRRPLRSMAERYHAAKMRPVTEEGA